MSPTSLWSALFRLLTRGSTVFCFACSFPGVEPDTTVQVFFDINIGGSSAGRVVMELRADVVPKTAGQWKE